MPLEKAYRWAQRMTTAEQNYEREPDPALRVSYVVPIRNEIRQANVFIQLNDFCRQRGANEHFEIVYVVNTALKERHTGTEHWYANQDILSLLAYAGGYTDALSVSVQPWQESILKRCREKGLRIVAIDESTKGMLTPGIEQARTIGDNYAKERFKKTNVGGNGAIVVLDADTRFGTHTTERINEQLVSRDGVGMIYGGFDMRPHIGPPQLFATAGAHRHLFNLKSVFEQLGLLQPHNGWYAAKAKALEKRSPRTARPYLRDLRMPTKGSREIADDIRMITQDRAHTAENGGSYGQQRLHGLTNGEHDAQLMTEDPTLVFLQRQLSRLKEEGTLDGPQITALEQILQASVPILFSDASDISISALMPSDIVGEHLYTCFKALLKDYPTERDVLQRCVVRSIKRERLVLTHAQHAVTAVLERAYDSKNPITIETLLTDVSKVGSRYRHYLEENPWIVDVCMKLKEEHPTPETAYAELQKFFPDILSPLQETPHTADTGILIGLSNFIAKVHRTPERFPFFSRILLETASEER